MSRKKAVRVEYTSNNSGGSWWLKDNDWKALAKAGWHVQWGGLWFCHSAYEHNDRPASLKRLCNKGQCRGHRRFEGPTAAAKERWLGSLARAATRDGLTLGAAIREWERVTGQDSNDLGCSCCGPPHSFSATDADGKHEYYAPEHPAKGERYAD